MSKLYADVYGNYPDVGFEEELLDEEDYCTECGNDFNECVCDEQEDVQDAVNAL